MHPGSPMPPQTHRSLDMGLAPAVPQPGSGTSAPEPGRGTGKHGEDQLAPGQLPLRGLPTVQPLRGKLSAPVPLVPSRRHGMGAPARR
eukprot:10220299-Heterocapsa_arctica.AAC.2